MPISLAEAQKRLEEAGSQFSGRYVDGASGKGSKWLSAAGQAEANFKQGMQEYLGKGSLARDMQAAGASAYDQGIATKGGLNWSTGMQTGGAKYAKNTQRFVPLWSASLATPRGSRRSPANLKRMTENVDRFSKAA